MFYVFISCWLCWVFTAARGLSLGAAIRDASPVALRGLLVAEASLLGGRGRSSWNPQAPERRLSSWGRARLLRSMWELPGSGI